MKKSYLMIAAAAALFAACSSNDTFKDINNDAFVSKIDFSTFAQKATRAAENSGETYSQALENHHSTFKVWGFKNTTADAVFFNETATHSGTAPDDTWAYENDRYWDRAASDYYFYACAPATNPFTFNGVSTDKADETEIAASKASQPNGYFTIASLYNKAGENVSPKNAQTKVEYWSTAGGTTDVDLMIADVCHYNKTANPTIASAITGKVQLHFIHILSRLNITLKYSSDFATSNTNGDIITVNNITIGHVKGAGTFNENTTLGSGVLAGGTDLRWTKPTTGEGSDVNYSYNIAYDATADANYVVEALIIPQTGALETITIDGTEVIADSETAPYMYINYTIWNSTKTKGETFEAYYNLATIFGITGTDNLAFNEGWQNTLNITIDPAKIEFDADVAQWDDNETNDLTVR